MEAMERIKVGVVGVGHLGREHARIYSELKNVDLIGVVDIDTSQAEKVAQKTGSLAYTDFTELIGKVQAVSIVTPTIEHYRVAKAFLSAGVDVMVEKPITKTVQEAEELIRIADSNGCILQVGHLERFNAAVQKVVTMITKPMFIECNRISPFPDRSTDVDVVLDLMIHDLDIILSLVQSKIVSVQAVGIPVLSNRIDIANARMEFASGCVANVTSSRISLKRERKIRIFQPPSSYISLDYLKQEVYAYHKQHEEKEPETKPKIVGGRVKVKKTEPLRAELIAFLAAVETRSVPLVSGIQGMEALKIVKQVQSDINRRNLRHLSGGERPD